MAPPPSGLSGGRAVVVLARAGGSGVAGTLATSSLRLLCHQGSDLGRSEVNKKLRIGGGCMSSLTSCCFTSGVSSFTCFDGVVEGRGG